MFIRRIIAALAAGLVATASLAFEVPGHDHTHDKEFRHPDLWWGSAYRPVAALPGALAREQMPGLNQLGVRTDHAYLDLRTGRWGTLIITRPMIPGPGVGNDLQWADLGRAEPRGSAELGDAAWDAFRTFLVDNAAVLNFDAAEFDQPNVSAISQRLIQIYLPRRHNGVEVRDSYVTATINSGNLVLMGQRNWGDINIDTRPSLSAEQASEALRLYLRDMRAPQLREQPRLVIVPTSVESDENRIAAIGAGLNYRLAWVLQPVIDRHDGDWEALVDAHTGELLAFQDLKQYTTRKIGGGVYPVSNDGTPPDGIEQPDWPMPFADIRLDGSPIGFTTTGGHVPPAAETGVGTLSTTLTGQYVNMADTCGAINESSAAGDLDLGDGAGTDCAVPPGASPGNTSASRTGFYELNRIAEQGRGYLPANTWLQNQLTAEMNINDNCNAWFSPATGNIGFFTSGGGCANTGEIAAVFDHEWGHGMDFNSTNSGISRPGEGIADIYAQNRLNDSCVGRGFRPGVNCTGFGDACLECTGVRESDWAKQASGQPHDVSWIMSACTGSGNTPCGRSTHCEGSIVAEAVWDLVHRDLQGFDGSDFNYDPNTALEMGTRLTYEGAGNVGNWYQCVTNGTAGCNADSGYLNYLAANDDNGDLTDGTPHMSAIFAAFDRHQIACPTPVIQDSGCSSGPQSAPQNIQAVALDQGAALTWDAVPDATEYWIFRTEGVHGCDFGKTRVGITADTQFTEIGLRNEMEALYSVVAVGSSDTCTSPMSACQAVTPFPGPSGDIVGTVTRAATDIPAEGALVQSSGPAVFSRMTGAAGEYQMTVLEGVYEVTASKDGHGTATVTDVQVDEDGTVELHFALDTPIADPSPLAFEIEVAEGGSAIEVLDIANPGSLDLEWAIGTDVVETTAGSRDHDPDLDEAFQLPDFTVHGAASNPPAVEFTVDAGVLTRGDVVGFSFVGTATGVSGSSSYASDTCLVIQAPDGSSFGVGGFGSASMPGCGAANGWNFQGAGSTNDGTYESQHDGVFSPPAEDQGTWTLTFVNDWESASAADISWSDVSVTLHKAPLPICQEPEAASWLSVSEESGQTAPESATPITVTADSAGLAQGVYEAYLCLVTNDADASLVPIPVQLTVIEPPEGELAVIPDSLDFGEVASGGSATQSFAITNGAVSGALAIEISGFAVTDGEDVFSISGGDCAEGAALTGQQSCNVEVTFSPAGVGEYDGAVTVGIVGGATATVALSGSNTQDPGELQVTPSDLDFGEVALGNTGVVAVTVSNVAAEGAAELDLTQIELLNGGPEFAVGDTDCDAALAAQASCTVEVRFTPSGIAAYAGLLRIVADQATVDVNLSGNGIEPVPTVFEDRFEAP